MDQLNFKRFSTGDWLVDPDLNRISCKGKRVKLEPRTMAVLVYLARHAGAVISREELLSAVWTDSFVTENTLSRTVARLRKALGDDWQKPRYLETISKSGYRWIGSVNPLQPGEAEAFAHEREKGAGAERRKAKSRWGLLALLLIVLGAGIFYWRRPPERDALQGPFQVRPAVTMVGRQANPVLSPDGRHIAFSWQDPESSSWDIYVQSLDEDSPLRVTNDPEIKVLPAWSPDSGFLAFVAGSGECGIYQISRSGGSWVRMAECMANPRSLNWSPDAERFAFDGIDPETGMQALFLATLGSQSQAPERLVAPDLQSEGDWQPVFSPNGSKLAFVRRQNADLHHVYIHDLRKRTTERLTAHEEGRIRGLDWTRDGKSIVYSYNRDGRFALWRIRLRGGSPQKLPIVDNWVTYPSLARNANALIYKNYVDVVDLKMLDLDESGAVAGDARPLAPSTRSELHPRLSPTDERIAFLSNRTGAFEVWSGKGDRPIRHSRLEGLEPGLVDWHPSGSPLVFDVRQGGQSDLFTVEATGDTPQPLTQTPFNEVNPRFSQTGSSLYFASDQDGDWQIWEMDLISGSRHQLTREGGFLAQVGPDGRKVFFSKLNQSGIFELDPDNGGEVRIWQGLGLDDWGNWQVCASGIYYLDRSTQSLMHQPASGEPRLVYRAPHTFPYLGPAFHVAPDERRIAIGQITHSDDEVMLATYR